MKTIFQALLLSLVTVFYAHAGNINFVYYYPPGGGTDVWTAPIVDGFQEKGYTVKKEFFNNCVDAINFANRQTEPTFIVAAGLDILPETAKRCQAQSSQPGLNLVTNISSGSFYLCTSPNKSNITFKDLQGNQQYIVGTTTNDLTMRPLQGLLSQNPKVINVKLIPYYSQGELRAAALAGTDIDLIYIASNVEAITSAGGVCIASSTAKNHLGLPWLGELAPEKFMDAYVEFELWGFNKNVSSTEISLLTEIFKGQRFQNHLAARPSFTHLGLGVGIRSADSQDTRKRVLNNLGLK